jgi:hypothetical protein
MPHHLAQGDEQGGAYTREGKSYHRLWVHMIHQGSKTRFWSGDGEVQATQVGATTAEISVHPGEEYALSTSTAPDPIDITRSLTNPLVPQQNYQDVGTPWDNQDDSASMYRGVHGLPANERKLAARGLTIGVFVRFCAAKVRFLGWGGEFGAGSHNIYRADPEYPYPVPVP